MRRGEGERNQDQHELKVSVVKDIGGCTCMSMTILARPLDNKVQPRFKDAKQHFTQLAWFKDAKIN